VRSAASRRDQKVLPDRVATIFAQRAFGRSQTLKEQCQRQAAPTVPIDNDTYRAIFELHELGHILGGTSNDSTDSQRSLDYDQTIIQKCFPQLIAK